MNITTIIESVGESLRVSDRDDLPAIRQALNDAVDQAVRAGEMTDRQANSWNQTRAVKAVQKALIATAINRQCLAEMEQEQAS